MVSWNLFFIVFLSISVFVTWRNFRKKCSNNVYAISKWWFLSVLVLGEEQPTGEVNNPSNRHEKKTYANRILPKPSGALDKIMTKNSKVSCLLLLIEQRWQSTWEYDQIFLKV